MPQTVSLTTSERSEEELLDAIRVLPDLRRRILSYLVDPTQESGARLAAMLGQVKEWLPPSDAEDLTGLSDFLGQGMPLDQETVKQLMDTVDVHVFEDIWMESFESDVVVDLYLERGHRHSDAALKILYGRRGSRSREMEQRIATLKDFIYRHPGLFKTQLAALVARSTSIGVTESRIEAYVDLLAERKEILTVGGPQGNYRFCFPHPSRVTNRQDFYGKKFGIEGFIKKIQDKPVHYAGLGRFCRFGVVNSHMGDVGVMFPMGSFRDPKDLISGFGILRPIEGNIPEEVIEEMHVEGEVGDYVTPVVLEEVLAGGQEVSRWIDPEMIKSISPQP